MWLMFVRRARGRAPAASRPARRLIGSQTNLSAGGDKAGGRPHISVASGTTSAAELDQIRA